MAQNTLPLLSDSADSRDAIVWLRALTRWMGPGFHPDTRAAEYVCLETGQSTFSPDEAQQLDRDMDRAINLLEAHGRDPYQVASKVQRRLLGWS